MTKQFEAGRVATWQLAARILFVALLLLSFSTAKFLTDSALVLGYLVTILAFSVSAFSAIYIRKTEPGIIFSAFQAALDVLLITAVIYLTGAAISPFLFLYLPLAMFVSVSVSRRAGLFVTFGSVSAYLLLVFGLTTKLILPADGGALVILPSSGVPLQIIGLTSAMVLVSVAAHYLSRRLSDSDKLVLEGQNALKVANQAHSVLVAELQLVESQIASHNQLAKRLANKDYGQSEDSRELEFSGLSCIMQKVQKLVRSVAESDATVVVSGESGTGKELVARSIHRLSGRHFEPFVAVNCGAIPENLIESELFGHKRGAFTGADSDYLGLIRKADKGTLFLDEIGELPLLMQTKLLRVLQERTVRPVGSNTDIPVSIRVVAATNRNLRAEIKSGNFREDLYYRLNVVSIHLPPLRERLEDLPELIGSILKKLAKTETLPSVPPAAMQILQSYHYPGNIRELENILERAVVLCPEVVLPENLPKIEETVSRTTEIRQIEGQELPVNLDSELLKLEQNLIENALLTAVGDRKRTAELLGISLRSLRYRLKKFGLEELAGDEMKASEFSGAVLQ